MEGVDLLIKANHIPAFTTIIESYFRLNKADIYETENNFEDCLEILLDKNVDNVSMQTLRYIAFRYYRRTEKLIRAARVLVNMLQVSPAGENTVFLNISRGQMKAVGLLNVGIIQGYVRLAQVCEAFAKESEVFREWWEERSEGLATDVRKTRSDGYTVYYE